MRKRVIIAGVTGLLLLGGVAGWQVKGRGAQPLEDVRLGQQRRMALRLTVHLSQPGAAQPLVVTIEGDFLTTVAAVRPGEKDVACELEGARVTGGGQVPEEERAALARRLSRRFWVTYRDDGSALRLHVQRDLPADERNILQLLVTETVLVRPATAKPHWTATERDGSGTYFATYQFDAGRLVKQKLKYFNAETADAPAMAIAVTAARWQFTLDGAGELLALEGTDQLRITTPIAGPPSAKTQGNSHLDMRADVHLTAAGTGRRPEEVGSLERERGAVDSVPIGVQAFDREKALLARDQRLLEGQSAAELLDPRRTREADPLLPARLAALFRRQPEAISAVVQSLRQVGRRDLVTAALATAGTPAALAALGALARDHTALRQLRIDALNALLRRVQPGPTELGIAADLLDDGDAEVRRAARLVYGGLAHALAEVDPAGRAAVERALLARYAAAGAGERADLLDALGNSAGPQILAPAVAALAEPQAEVRSAAAGALGRVEDPAADRVLADHLRGEADDQVRLAVVRAAAERWPDRPTPEAPPRAPGDPLVAALLQAMSADRSEAVRAAAVSLLRRHLDLGLEVSAALKRAAATDPSPGVRRLAAEWRP